MKHWTTDVLKDRGFGCYCFCSTCEIYDPPVADGKHCDTLVPDRNITCLNVAVPYLTSSYCTFIAIISQLLCIRSQIREASGSISVIDETGAGCEMFSVDVFFFP